MKASKILIKHQGRKRALEIMDTMSKWQKGLVQHKAGVPISDRYKIEDYSYNKSATTQVDGNAGFLVPELVSAEVAAVLQEYGQILPRISQVEVPAGGRIRVNELITLPVAVLRTTECTALTAMAMALNETPKYIQPDFVGGVLPVSNEMLNAPGANFSELFFNLLVDVTVGAQEKLILQQAVKGLLVDTAVIDQDPVDTTDPISVTRFVTDALVTNTALSNADHSLIIAPPTIMPQMATAGANPIMKCGPGGAARFICYDMVPHVHSQNGPWYISMVDTRNIFYATGGSLIMDINPFINGNNNCSLIKGGQHFDFALCHQTLMSRAEVQIAS